MAQRKLGCGPLSRRRSSKSGVFGGFTKTAEAHPSSGFRGLRLTSYDGEWIFLASLAISERTIHNWAHSSQKHDFYPLFSARSGDLKMASKFDFEGA